MLEEEESVRAEDEDKVIALEEVVRQGMLAGSRPFFNTLSGLLVADVFL